MRVIIKNADFQVYGLGDISGLLSEVSSKFGGISDITPVETFFRALGADGSNEIWPKIKCLYMPCLGVPTDGANALYDIIGKENYPGSNYTIEAKRGVSPTTLGQSIGESSIPSGIDDSNMSFFGVITQSSRQTLGSSSGEAMRVGGIIINWQSVSFVLTDETNPLLMIPSGGFLNPIPFVLTSPENGMRTLIGKQGQNTAEISKTINYFNLSGRTSWADSSILAICSGLTAEDANVVLTALNSFITDYGVVSAN